MPSAVAVGAGRKRSEATAERSSVGVERWDLRQLTITKRAASGPGQTRLFRALSGRHGGEEERIGMEWRKTVWLATGQEVRKEKASRLNAASRRDGEKRERERESA